MACRISDIPISARQENALTFQSLMAAGMIEFRLLLFLYHFLQLFTILVSTETR